jgi:hypothetical protein
LRDELMNNENKIEKSPIKVAVKDNSEELDQLREALKQTHSRLKLAEQVNLKIISEGPNFYICAFL